ncbi:MAG: mucoidy inhibitor MuiA family protein [Anaerolineales bacterium]
MEIDSHLTAVTVFPDRARLTRTARARLEPGQHRLTFSQLPLALLPDSVRASGKGTARAKLLGVSTRLENFVETPAEAVRDLENKIQAAEDADADLAARAGVLEKEQKHLDGLAAQSEMFARGLALRNRTPEEQAAIFRFITDRLAAIQAELLKVARERRDLAKELDRLRRELAQARSARPKQRYVATVEVEVSAAGDLDLELIYVVTGAGWQPLYDLRLNDSRLDAAYLAQVSQNTGEDWPDVALTLSTAQPALSLVVPELDPWYVRPYAPRPQVMMAKRSAPVPAAPAAMAADMAVTAAGAPPEAAPLQEQAMDVDTAAVSESGAALTYRLGARAEIPGNNDPRKVTIAAFGLEPDLDYVTAPRREQVCYRRATVKNTSFYSFLPGSAQLFEGDDYLGATRLEFIAPGQEFELALGADERLRVERKLAARDVDKAFLIGDRRRIRYAYTIEVENLRDRPQTVYVRDQIPVSRDEQIKVKLDSADPKPARHTDLNQLEWKLTLDPSARQTIRFDFSVDFPRAMDVIGLP